MKPVTAREAGWKYSKYNLFAEEAELEKVAWLNTLSGSCSEFSKEEYLQTQRVLDLPEDDPLIAHYAGRGLITRKDETEELRKRFSERWRNKWESLKYRGFPKPLGICRC